MVLVLAGGAALVSPWAVRPLLSRMGAIDVPNARSSHRQPVVRGGGLATAIGIAVAWSLARPLDPTDGILVAVVFGAALSAAAVGLVEDVRGLSVTARLLAQLGVGATVGIIGTVVLDRPLPLALLVTVAFAGYVNVANFMDGIDGLSAGHGIVAGGWFWLVGRWDGLVWLELAGAVCAVVFAAFLPWNIARRRRTFLGDVGSYLLGALVSASALLAWLSGVPVVAAVAPLVPYLADCTVTVVRRARRGERLTVAHRTHVYQRLTDRGWNHLQAAGAVAATSALCCGAALLALIGLLPSAAAIVLALGIVTVYLALPRIVDSRRGQRAPA